MELKIIARIENAYTSKFGVPRQSGLVEEVISRIVFEPEYRVEEALRGLEEFTFLWLIWGFHEAHREEWKPTVRPPRLGGNTRMGVFATRSPYRPNALGLSSVRLLGREKTPERGEVLLVSGADLMNGTPIYDIKPYLPSADCHPEARGGFTDNHEKRRVKVEIPEPQAAMLSTEDLAALRKVLAEDPRPAYQQDPERIYAFEFAGQRVRFRVEGETLTVLEIGKR
ncbi:MAG: tRNA (N6-threonylcarbamoyladenosine(37)-N6)-methyltransferase TrmO [Clostridia bacterium]|nr:tRNA (N6-threonylcarbamoyladenosine(37)-N6)-methyltransferase TrmO [Clostridia bacterium]